MPADRNVRFHQLRTVAVLSLKDEGRYNLTLATGSSCVESQNVGKGSGYEAAGFQYEACAQTSDTQRRGAAF